MLTAKDTVGTFIVERSVTGIGRCKNNLTCVSSVSCGRALTCGRFVLADQLTDLIHDGKEGCCLLQSSQTGAHIHEVVRSDVCRYGCFRLHVGIQLSEVFHFVVQHLIQFESLLGDALVERGEKGLLSASIVEQALKVAGKLLLMFSEMSNAEERLTVTANGELIRIALSMLTQRGR